MRLAEGVEGFETLRSTSFSTSDEKKTESDLAVGDVVDIFHLLQMQREKGEDAAIETFCLQHQLSQSDQLAEQNKNILRNTMQYLEAPVIMRDTDQSLVGCWPDRVSQLEQLKLSRMPQSTMKPVLLDLLENEDKEGKGSIGKS